mmetsp:Transcript_63707/g.136963  ORF Transcript_63707/g.136963 Transcript_63707/m.136963 type:complete len:574 (-) Transcript_63707:94-1815(-)
MYRPLWQCRCAAHAFAVLVALNCSVEATDGQTWQRTGSQLRRRSPPPPPPPPLAEGERPLRNFGTARYPDSQPLLTWEDLRDRGRLGAPCEAVGGPAAAAAQCGKGLVCRKSICRHCLQDHECPALHRCTGGHHDWGSKLCVPFEQKVWEQAIANPWGEGLCTLLVFLAAALAAGAGVGGGGVFVPLLVMLSGLRAELAVPLSQCMILCASIVNIAIFLPQSHPDFPKQPVIDYDCVLLLEPMLGLGVTIGVLLNQTAPQWLILVLLCMTLGFALWRTVSKGLKQWGQESSGPTSVVQPQLQSPPESARAQILMCVDMFVKLTKAHSLQVVGLVMIWLLMLASSFHGLPACSWKFVAFLLGLATVLVVCTTAAVRVITRQGRTSELVMPIAWVSGGDLWSCMRVPLAAFGTGLLGGGLGIGGGVILGPVLLEMGMHSEAVQATTAIFVFLSSSLATIQFALLSQHIWHYALWYSVAAVLATLLGQHLCAVLVRKRGRYSLITFAIAGILLASLTALMIVGVRRSVEDFRLGQQLWFSSARLCNSGGLGIVSVDVIPAQAWPRDLPPWPPTSSR